MVAEPAAAEVVGIVGMPVVEAGRGCGVEELGSVTMGGVGGLAVVGRRDERWTAGAMMAQVTQRERCCSSLVAKLAGRLGGRS